MQTRKTDIVIIGAGPVGSALALALAQTGFSVILADAGSPNPSRTADLRNFAIVTGSWRLLSRLGVTAHLTDNAEPLLGLDAVDGGGHIIKPPAAMFRAEDASPFEEPLGYMVQANTLQSGLEKALSTQKGLQKLSPLRFDGIERADHLINCRFEDGSICTARLIIGADGTHSRVREAAGIGVTGRDYKTSVLTANVRLERPHEGIARQIFTPEGPFATLPLPGDRANLAWYMKRGAAEALSTWPVRDIERELNTRFEGFAGKMQIESDVATYPLILQLAETLITARIALIGDAARRINPLAGQGLNQGFRDIAALTEVLEDARAAGLDIGSEAVLHTYNQARRFDAMLASLALDGIDRLFSNDYLLTKPIRAIGLSLAQRLTPLRRAMARQASAVEGGIPRLMQAL